MENETIVDVTGTIISSLIVLFGFSLSLSLSSTVVHDICWSLPAPTNNELGGSVGLVPKLTNIQQIVGISTYGAPQHIVTLAGDNGRRMIANGVRHGIAPDATVSWLGLYGIEGTTHEQRTDFLKQVDSLVKEL